MTVSYTITLSREQRAKPVMKVFAQPENFVSISFGQIQYYGISFLFKQLSSSRKLPAAQIYQLRNARLFGLLVHPSIYNLAPIEAGQI
jgi:hypothetical protein